LERTGQVGAPTVVPSYGIMDTHASYTGDLGHAVWVPANHATECSPAAWSNCYAAKMRSDIARKHLQFDTFETSDPEGSTRSPTPVSCTPTEALSASAAALRLANLSSSPSGSDEDFSGKDVDSSSESDNSMNAGEAEATQSTASSVSSNGRSSAASAVEAIETQELSADCGELEKCVYVEEVVATVPRVTVYCGGKKGKSRSWDARRSR